MSEQITIDKTFLAVRVVKAIWKARLYGFISGVVFSALVVYFLS